MEVSITSGDKLKYALAKFLEPGFFIKNEGQINSLLGNLVCKGAEGVEENIVLEKEFLKAWIIDAVSLWEVTEKLPDSTVVALAVQILALLSKKEQQCFDLRNMAFFEKIINVLKLRDKNSVPMVKQAFIKLLSSLLEHESGVDFLVISRYWKDVFEMCLTKQNIDMTREGLVLFSEFLGKLSLTHEDFCTNVVQRMIKPLEEVGLNILTLITSKDFNEEEVYFELLPTLRLVIKVMEYAYNKQLNFEPEAKLVVIIHQNMDVEKGLRNLMLVIKAPDFFCDVKKISVLYLLQQLLVNSKDGVCTSIDLDVIHTKLKDFVYESVENGRFYIPRILNLFLCYWHQLQQSKYELEDVFWDKQKMVMEDHVAALLVMPFCGMDFKYSNSADEFLDYTCHELIKKTNPYILSIQYKWEALFNVSDRGYLANFHKELPYIMNSRTMFSRENNVFLFLCCFYFLKSTIDNDCPAVKTLLVLHPNFVADILYWINTFIREFNIKWTDSFESICVFNTTYDFINLDMWENRVIVAGLKLITTSIEKYMTPNMTLLIDRVNDSSINELGPFLVAKLHDPECQVRDSALETILVIAEASKCKFQSFRSILCDVQIPRIVLGICLNDDESFVRAAALKCLAKMCLVDEYWDNFLETQEVVSGSMEVSNTSRDKLKYALAKSLEPGFYFKNEGQINALLTNLVCKGAEGLEENIVLEKKFLKTWIIDAVSLWEVTEKLPDITVVALAVQILALLSKKEHHCFDLRNMAFFEKIINVLKLRDKDSVLMLKQAFIKLLSSLLEHESGVDFLVISGYWEDVFEMCLTRQNIDLTRDGQVLFSEFLGRASLTHEDFCTNVIQRMIKPLEEVGLNILTLITIEDFNEEEVYVELLPTLRLVIKVMEYAYDKQLNFEPEAKLVVIIHQNMDVQKGLCNLKLVVKDPDFFCDVKKISVLYLLQQLLVNSKDGVCTSIDLDVIYIKLKDFVFESVENGRFYIPRILYLFLCYWHQLQKSKYKLEDVIWDNQKMVMEDQIAALLILPFCGMDFKYWISSDEFMDHTIDELIKKTNHYIQTVQYKWRDLFNVSDRGYLTNFHKELPYMMSSRKMFSRENNVMIFLCFFYFLKGIIENDNPSIQTLVLLNPNFIADILYGLNTFIREFNIKWTDSFESICVFNTIYDFLNLDMWDNKVIVAGLKLITTSIEKYMTPNMTLLIDRINDSSINQLGPFLVAKLHDPECQVRYSALETILVIADASKCKFQSFRSILSEVQIPSLVLEISLNDEESFVRATALKCLSRMCLVNEYWDNFLSMREVPEKTIKMLQNETEGIVRTEAATLLTTLYQHQPFSLDICTAIYETMVSAVINDLHWEVRLNALSFWENTLEDELTKQGMIDGEFPESIFSIEKKRIIHLNNEEIAKRLSSVVQKLCDVGCLAVLTTALQDDCNLQVSKRALQILNRLIKLLEKYNVKSVEHQCVESTFNDVVSPSSDSSGVVTSPQSVIDGDMIIDEILGSTDSALLKGVYFPSDSAPVRDSNFVNRRRKVSCSSFFEFLKLDLRGILNDREKWLDSLDSLDSLLNDILDSYDENNDLNVMDCY